MKRLMLVTVVCLVVGLLVGSTIIAATRSKIAISVMDLTAGRPLKDRETITPGVDGDRFQVTVNGNGGDCAGQYVVSALGAPGGLPSVLVQFVPFIIGPGVGNNSVTGPELTANPGVNAWKISASCNGAGPKEFDFDSFEFFTQ